jgi:hypothetical protein
VPSYSSPEFNPIGEEAFSKIKGLMRKAQARVPERPCSGGDGHGDISMLSLLKRPVASSSTAATVWWINRFERRCKQTKKFVSKERVVASTDSR